MANEARPAHFLRLSSFGRELVTQVNSQATNSTFFGEKRNQMNRHKFKVGQTVMYLARERTSGTYKITQLMPSEGGDFQYRIRNTSEPHERVVKESDLDRAA